MPAAKAARTGPERAVPAGGPSRTREELPEDILPEEIEEVLPEETPLEDEEADADFFEKAEDTSDDDDFRRP